MYYIMPSEVPTMEWKKLCPLHVLCTSVRNPKCTAYYRVNCCVVNWWVIENSFIHSFIYLFALLSHNLTKPKCFLFLFFFIEWKPSAALRHTTSHRSCCMPQSLVSLGVLAHQSRHTRGSKMKVSGWEEEEGGRGGDVGWKRGGNTPGRALVFPSLPFTPPLLPKKTFFFFFQLSLTP